MSKQKKNRPYTEEEIECLMAGFDELVRTGFLVQGTDEHGNLIFRDGKPVYERSPKALNFDAGMEGLN